MACGRLGSEVLEARRLYLRFEMGRQARVVLSLDFGLGRGGKDDVLRDYTA